MGRGYARKASICHFTGLERAINGSSRSSSWRYQSRLEFASEQSQPRAGPEGLPDFPQVLEQLCRQATADMAARGAVLLLYDDLADAFSIAAASGQSVSRWVGREVEDGDSTLFREVLERRVIIAAPPLPASLAELEVLAGQLIPLHNDVPVGVLLLFGLAEPVDEGRRVAMLRLGEAAAEHIQLARPDLEHHCMFRRILELDPGGIAVVEGPDHVFSYANLAFRQVLKHDRVPLLGRSLRALRHSLPGVEGALDDVRWSREPQHMAQVAVVDEYGPRYYEVHLAPERALDGEVASTVLTIWPRTDAVLTRKALETSLTQFAQSQSMLSAVLNSTNNGIFLVGPALEVLYANRRIGDLLGLDFHSVVGRDKRDVVTAIKDHMVYPDDFERRLLYLYDHPEETTTEDVEVLLPSRRTLERYSSPVYTDDGARLGRIEVYSDVTEVRALQRNKDEFLSLVSHELKTPVTSIRGYAQLLHRRAVRDMAPESTLNAYTVIERQTTRMQDLIDSLLDLTRLETDRMALALADVNLGRLVTRVGEMMEMTQEDRQLLFDLSSEPVIVVADEQRIEQVVMNLLSNALRFSPEGGVVTISVRRERDARIIVRDEGKGIAPDARERIFERFFRAEHVPDASGMGVGLYITKGIVERHGGTISVESELGSGSTFTVSLPYGGTHSQPSYG